MLNQKPHDHFRMILLTVVGQAFTAAGYELEERPRQWAGGLFRFVKKFDNGLYGYIEFQFLNYVSTEWAEDKPSRFRVTLTRSDQSNASTATQHPQYARRNLSALVVEDFGVPILPSADFWWPFTGTEQLGRALAEAGHLVIGYGMSWLSGDLTPPERKEASD